MKFIALVFLLNFTNKLTCNATKDDIKSTPKDAEDLLMLTCRELGQHSDPLPPLPLQPLVVDDDLHHLVDAFTVSVHNLLN